MHSDSQPFVRIAVWGETFTAINFTPVPLNRNLSDSHTKKGHKMDTERAQNSESCSAYKDLCGG